MGSATGRETCFLISFSITSVGSKTTSLLSITFAGTVSFNFIKGKLKIKIFILVKHDLILKKNKRIIIDLSGI
jgi:hypothetical protein